MILRQLGLLTIFLLTAACAPTPAAPQSADPFDDAPQQTPVFTAIPTLTPAPPTAEAGPPQTNAGAGTAVYDFVEQMCNAQWMNGGRHFDECPTNVAANQVTDGYVNELDPLTLNLKAGVQVLVTYPAQNEYSAIFGRFPAYRVNAGDQFYSHLGCMVDSMCDVEFALEYYDSNGNYHSEFAKWHYRAGEPMIEAIVDLTPLQGQRVEFTLAVRPQDKREEAWAIWVGPQIIQAGP